MKTFLSSFRIFYYVCETKQLQYIKKWKKLDVALFELNFYFCTLQGYSTMYWVSHKFWKAFILQNND